MPTLRVRLFGTGRLFEGDVEIKLSSRMWTLPLLSYLVLHRGEVIPRWRLAFTLWPDETEEVALVNLRRNLHRLVASLPRVADDAQAWVTVDAASISWSESAGFELDVAEFERLRADPATIERAIVFYTGDLLEELHFDWIAAERERLRQLYQADLVSLIVANRSRRIFSVAAQYAQRLLKADPWREDALRHLMSARYESGDGAGALAEFDRFARELRTEMNVDPMPETLALREAIARGAPIPGASAPPEPAAKRTSSAVPFVGRENELGRLRGQWQRAAVGSGGVAFISGEAGIGKSRLVSELALIAEAEGGRVLAGTTSLPERDPYQCLSTALRGALPLIAGVSLAPPLLAALAELVPELRAHRSDIPRLARLDPESDRSRLLDALAQLFVALARPRPVLVVLEDLHRAGAATIDVLSTLAPLLSRSAVLVLATYRTGEVDRSHPLRVFEHSSHAVAESVSVGPLDGRDVTRLVEAIAPRGLTSPEFVAALIRQSEGNPLFVTELLRDAQSAGLESLVMPTSVTSMVTARVASLIPASRAVAEIAATAGEAFTVDMVREIAGLPEGELLDGLDGLLDRHVVRESTERARYEYAFTHHLIHAAIYESIPAGVRARRHRRIARMLDTPTVEDQGERSREIALHYERGGDSANAAVHYTIAAKRAARLNANAESRDLVTRALSLDSANDRQRCDLLLLRSRMNARLADARAESADLDELEAIAAHRDEDAICGALVRRVDLAFRRGDHAARVQAIERLAHHATLAGGQYWLGAAAEARSTREHDSGEHGKSIASALEASAHYERAGDDIAYARVMALAARSCAVSPGRAADAERLASDALRVAERSGDAEVRLDVLRCAGHVAQERQDYARFGELTNSALALCLEVGDRGAEALFRGALGLVSWTTWQIDESVSQHLEALRLFESLGVVGRVVTVMVNLGAVLADVGDFVSAIAWARRAEEHALTTHSFWAAAVASVNRAEVAWQCGDIAALAAALHDGEAYVERVPESRYEAFFFLNRGRLLRCERKFEESARELERAIGLYDQTGRWADAASALGDLALTHLGCGAVAAARDALNRCTEIIGARSAQAEYPIRRYWIDACVHRAAEGYDDARQALRRAYDTFVERRDRLVDGALRASFEAIPVHRAIRAAIERDEWPAADSPCVVAFPEPPAPPR